LRFSRRTPLLRKENEINVLTTQEIRERFVDEIDQSDQSFALHLTARSLAEKPIEAMSEDEYFSALLKAETELGLSYREVWRAPPLPPTAGRARRAGTFSQPTSESGVAGLSTPGSEL
jgi:hypothetical protein